MLNEEKKFCYTTIATSLWTLSPRQQCHRWAEMSQFWELRELKNAPSKQLLSLCIPFRFRFCTLNSQKFNTATPPPPPPPPPDLRCCTLGMKVQEIVCVACDICGWRPLCMVQPNNFDYQIMAGGMILIYHWCRILSWMLS